MVFRVVPRLLSGTFVDLTSGKLHSARPRCVGTQGPRSISGRLFHLTCSYRPRRSLRAFSPLPSSLPNPPWQHISAGAAAETRSLPCRSPASCLLSPLAIRSICLPRPTPPPHHPPSSPHQCPVQQPVLPAH